MVKNTSTPNTSIVLPKRTKTGKVIKDRGIKLYPYEVGLTTLISDKALKKEFAQHTLEALKDRILSTFYRHCVVWGLKPLAITNRPQREESWRAWELTSVIDVVDDNSITATLLKVNDENDRLATALLAVNKLSWFQLIKCKLTRKKIIDFSYEIT